MRTKTAVYNVHSQFSVSLNGENGYHRATDFILGTRTDRHVQSV